jgi:hypothetical protein
MWWLLVPVIGAVVAAVANSGDEEKEAAERRARMQAREAADKAEAAAIARRKQADLVNRKTQLVKDVKDQLSDLLVMHPDVVERPSSAALNVSFETLQLFANKEPAIRPSGLLKQLDDLAPGLSLSPIWTARTEQVRTLQKQITGLKRLKEELLG